MNPAIVVLVLAPRIGSQEPLPFSLPLDAARDATGEGLAFVETSAAKPAYFVEEPIRLTLRFGVEKEFLATKMVQPFGRPLDVPVQVSAPWIVGFPGTLPLGVVEVPPGPDEAVRPTFALNESVHHAARAQDRVVDGKSFRVFEVQASFLPTSEGVLRFPAPLVVFAYATKFEEDLVRGRAPADRIDAFAGGEPFALSIQPLPLEGRPSEFTGAVGRLSVRAEALPREIEMGESLRLSLTIEGEGNLARFEAPRWSEIGAFRVLGTVDESSPTSRRIVYDLAPVSEKVWQVPVIPFAYFDPGPPGQYRVARTEPIEVEVRAKSRAARVEASRPEPGAAPKGSGTGSSSSVESAELPGARFPVPWSLLVLGGVLLLLALAAGLSIRLRARRIRRPQ